MCLMSDIFNGLSFLMTYCRGNGLRDFYYSLYLLEMCCSSSPTYNSNLHGLISLVFFTIFITYFLPQSVPHISMYHEPAGCQSSMKHHWGLQTHLLLGLSNYLDLLLLNVLLTVSLRGVKYLFCHKVSWRRLNSC